MALPSLINGINHSWSSIILTILGAPSLTVQKITYKKTRNIENNYGAGSMPISRGFGNFEFEASLELFLDEVEVLKNLVPTHDLQDIPEFDIVVSFLTEGKVANHNIRKCRFLTNGVDVAQGDTKISVSLDLVVGNIEY